MATAITPRSGAHHPVSPVQQRLATMASQAGRRAELHLCALVGEGGAGGVGGRGLPSALGQRLCSGSGGDLEGKRGRTLGRPPPPSSSFAPGRALHPGHAATGPQQGTPAPMPACSPGRPEQEGLRAGPRRGGSRPSYSGAKPAVLHPGLPFLGVCAKDRTREEPGGLCRLVHRSRGSGDSSRVSTSSIHTTKSDAASGLHGRSCKSCREVLNFRHQARKQ